MMRKQTAIFLTKILIITFFSTSTSWGEVETYSWFNQNLSLPFPKKWAANGSSRKEVREPWVFFETSDPPRISATLYHTNFELNPKDYSAFQDQLLKSKMEWIKSQESNLIGKIEAKPLKSEESALSYMFAFKGPKGTFREIGQFRRCKGKSFTLKAIIPQEKWDSKSAKEIQDFILYENPCLK